MNKASQSRILSLLILLISIFLLAPSPIKAQLSTDCPVQSFDRQDVQDVREFLYDLTLLSNRMQYLATQILAGQYSCNQIRALDREYKGLATVIRDPYRRQFMKERLESISYRSKYFIFKLLAAYSSTVDETSLLHPAYDKVFNDEQGCIRNSELAATRSSIQSGKASANLTACAAIPSSRNSYRPGTSIKHRRWRLGE